MLVLRRVIAVLTLAALTAPAAAQEPEPVPEPAPAATSPCTDPALALRCPDLIMGAPSDLRVQRVGPQVRLLARNNIVNIGQGPLELRGTPSTALPGFARGYQVVRRTDGRAPAFFPEAGWIYFKAIPGQGHYWKFWRAARFELWSLNPDGTRARMVRTGPKLSYCFRDLQRARTWPRTPRHQVFPACSRSAGQRRLRLGVSPGWADVYPATYHENWISVTGLRGCFDFVHRADPLGEIIEQREDNNAGSRTIQLPPRGGSVAPRSCPVRK